jgi:hypothetical protein
MEMMTTDYLNKGFPKDAIIRFLPMTPEYPKFVSADEYSAYEKRVIEIKNNRDPCPFCKNNPKE